MNDIIRRFVRVGAVIGALVVIACQGNVPLEPDDRDPSGPVALTPEDLAAFAWVGTYEGIGEGVLNGESVSIRPARLTIRFDAEDVRLARCPYCVTLVLDSLFFLTNVGANDAVVLNAEYRRDGLRRILLLERFSDGIATGTVLRGRLFVRPVEGGADVADISYLLERR